MSDQRYLLLQQWLAHQLPKQAFTVQPIPGDASFRRYFRVQLADHSYIAMDAPPDQENCRPFVAIAKAFAELEVQVPHIFAFDLSYGFLLLTDLGDQLYLAELSVSNVTSLYRNALTALSRIQKCGQIADWTLPHFGTELLTREWQLFLDWMLNKHWHVNLKVHEQTMLADTFELLAHITNSQPQVCVHRDYHSRNLLCLPNQGVGILDFQDAVWGPITYDAVSLLRDCYIDWPDNIIMPLCHELYEQLSDAGHLKPQSASFETFIYWLDLMGMQRHLKVLGIFTRLHYLYKKPNYLQYLPRILNYILIVSEKYPELTKFRQFLQHNMNATLDKGITL